MSLPLSTLWPLSFLVIAVIDDLCFQKFHNWLFLTLSLVGFTYTLIWQPIEPIQALGGFVVGGLLMLPLVLMGATGSGDMKFMMSFGILMGTIATFEVFLYALFWGALIGVLQIAFRGRLKQLATNLLGFVHKMKPAHPHKIPYTVAIMMGWFSYISWGGIL